MKRTRNRSVNGTQLFLWEVSTGKTGLPFQKFRLFRKIFSGTNKKVLFHLHPNRHFRHFFVNGKRPSTPQTHKGYINSSLLESDLKMSKSHANVLSLDENVSHLSNLFERNEHFLMDETAIGNKANIGTTDEITQNQRTYVTIQDNKHRLKDLRTDSSFETSRNEDEEVSKRSRSKSKFTENHRDCDVTKSFNKYSKKQVKYKTY